MTMPRRRKVACESTPKSKDKVRSGAALALLSLAISACTVSPDPLSRSEVRSQLASDMAQLPSGERKIAGLVDVERALVHAVLYNRGLRLKTLETALSRQELGTSTLSILPKLTLEAGYSRRNEYDASTSVVLIDGEPDTLPDEPAYSVSDELDSRTRDVTFTWNLLDFGLSYVRAQQSADRYLIEVERERKALQIISSDVRAAYWKAVSAERLLPRIDPLIADAKAALAEARSLEQDRSVPPRAALEDQRMLLDVLRLLQDLKTDLAGAKVELAEIMGLHPATEFELADVRSPDRHAPHMDTPIEVLEQAALENRPEMREAQYQTRISAKQARAGLLQLLPGIRLTAQTSYEDNVYLQNQNWQTLGASVNFNLFNIFSVAPVERRGEARRKLADQQRLATAMTVLAQVHISAAQFAQAKDAYALSSEYLNVAQRIASQADAAVATESAGSQELIRERLNAVLAELRRDRKYADMQNSFGRVLNSAGIDLFPRDYRELDRGTLTAVLEKRFDRISRGDMPLTPPSVQTTEKAVASAQAAERDVPQTSVVAAAPEQEREDAAAETHVERETSGERDDCQRRFLGLCFDPAGNDAADAGEKETETARETQDNPREASKERPTPDEAATSAVTEAREAEAQKPMSAIGWLNDLADGEPQ